VAAVKCKGKKAPAKGTPDHFEKLLEGLCPNHAYPIKHAYKDYSLMRWFLSRGSNKVIQRRSVTPQQMTPRGRRVPS
jgi:hypothetical protein